MSFAKTYTKFKEILEDNDFKESDQVFDFNYVPDLKYHRSFIITPSSMTEAKQIKDLNNYIYIQLSVDVLLAYKLNAKNPVDQMNLAGQDMEGMAFRFQQFENRPEDILEVLFKSADTKTAGGKKPTYLVSRYSYDVLYRKI